MDWSGGKDLTLEDTKKFLNQIYDLDTDINSLIEEKASYLELAEKITQNFDGERVQSSANHDKIADLTTKIVDTENEIIEKIDALYLKKTEISKILLLLDDPKQRQILCLRHIRFNSFSEISNKIGYEIRYTYKYYKKALNNFRNVLEDMK